MRNRLVTLACLAAAAIGTVALALAALDHLRTSLGA